MKKVIKRFWRNKVAFKSKFKNRNGSDKTKNNVNNKRTVIEMNIIDENEQFIAKNQTNLKTVSFIYSFSN